MIYHFQYEIAQGTDVIDEKTVPVSAKTEERAREWMENHLEGIYPGEDGYQLLSLECVGKDDE